MSKTNQPNQSLGWAKVSKSYCQKNTNCSNGSSYFPLNTLRKSFINQTLIKRYHSTTRKTRAH
ncbi:hypothetical protein HanXRQr2_Chr03g0106831 [Helianthus annuus]|uniref:Uncharacterized protein n=1 Tax=Helianthus annuus TaxID=4232 RepID=A0A9K3JFQ0_HELAN|nr:hypothetical protein HanXRQr2_Chr03g0106831 [Helianthus annuus]KAJ0943363.1 hypothetical protein HanPSC8_Chr03g0103341 [Helianthus annuus]